MKVKRFDNLYSQIKFQKQKRFIYTNRKGITNESIFKMKYLKIPSHDYSGTNLSETGRSVDYDNNMRMTSDVLDKNRNNVGSLLLILI
jgi:hypothetical protein